MWKKRILSILLAAGMVMSMLTPAAAGVSDAAAVAEDGSKEKQFYLSDLEWKSDYCGSLTDFPNGTGKDTAINGDPIRLMVDGVEKTFEKGLGTHAPSEIVYDIAGKGHKTFEAYAGVDLYTLNDHNNNSAEGVIGNFIVKIDGEVAAQSGEMNPTMDAHHFEVEIPADATTLTLVAETGSETWSDWADWADAKFIGGSGNTTVVTPEEGLTLDPVKGCDITVHMEKGSLNLYRGETLVAANKSNGEVIADGKTISDFAITASEVKEDVETEFGIADRIVLDMYSESAKMEKTLWIDVLEDIDGAIVTTTFLTAESAVKNLQVIENKFTLAEPDANRIWSYNGGGEGQQSWYDTLQKVNNSFYRENRQDNTAAAIPVSDIYSVNGGVTVGDASLYRKFLSTPVRGGNNTATVSIQWKNLSLAAGEETEVGTAIVGVHDGDYYNGLRTFADVMAAQGFSTPEYVPDASYDLRWESWGWEGAWTIDKILGKLDELYEQGIRQITLDDCWYTAAGDWDLNPDKFPKGVEDMKRLTDAIHEKGMTIVLWWRPMDGGRNSSFSVISGHVQKASNLIKEHPEYFVKNADGSFARLSGPGSSNSFNGSTGFALCPQSEGAVASQVEFVRRAMEEWGIDGFKSDYVWGMPKCYDKSHNHATPEESTETASNIFYKAIYEEMISIDEDAFHLLCNCGTPQDYYSFPYVNQIPTADPTSVDQTRRRVKAYKALAGDDFPITTDHNEIWYPSSVGTGAVLIEKRDFADGSAQEKEYYKWLNIADEHKLQEGTHIGDLYAYGIDPYETYVIEKDGMMYYSFYRDGKYKPSGNPEIELKGLDPDKNYRIEDYVNDKVLAEQISGADAVLNTTFSSYLLIRAIEIFEPADKAELEAAITEAEELNAEDYTEESWALLAEALEKAKAVFDKEEATQEEVDAAAAELASTKDMLEAPAFENPFTDVAETDYFYDEVLWGAEHGIVSGIQSDKFGPTLSCTRGQIATFIWRAEGKKAAEHAEVTFKDVSADSYYYDAIGWAVEAGIISGYNTEAFGPEDICTRAQLASILYRLAGSQKAENTKMTFKDIPAYAYYYDAVLWAVDEGIVSGYNAETFAPDDKVLRCDTVRMLYGYYVDEE